MSQRFNVKMDQMRQASPVMAAADQDGQAAQHSGGAFYPSSSAIRNLCFIWPDGRKLCLNYAYLIAAECNTADSEVILTFSTHIVTIKGYNFQMLFFDLMEQRLRLITCIEERYLALQPEGVAVVTEITVAAQS